MFLDMEGQQTSIADPRSTLLRQRQPSSRLQMPVPDISSSRPMISRKRCRTVIVVLSFFLFAVGVLLFTWLECTGSWKDWKRHTGLAKAICSYLTLFLAIVAASEATFLSSGLALANGLGQQDITIRHLAGIPSLALAPRNLLPPAPIRQLHAS